MIILIRIAIAVLALCVAGDARADRSTASSTPGISYLWDGGALPLFWGALGAQYAIDRWVDTRSTPLLFSPSEGGLSHAPWEVPSWTLTAGAITIGAAILADGGDARWYHVKGLAETLAVNGLMTGILKKTFGRHRPDWTIESTDPTKNQSFVSGHSTSTFAIATYSALYLHEHVFDRWRGSRTLPWWEGLAYTGIGIGAGILDAERLYHHRHHFTDVAVGSLLGAAEAMLVFAYQERRFRSQTTITITPTATETSVGLELGGTF